MSELTQQSPVNEFISEGLLILNDLYKSKNRMHYGWTQGSKVMFSDFDAKLFPDLYSGDNVRGFIFTVYSSSI